MPCDWVAVERAGFALSSGFVSGDELDLLRAEAARMQDEAGKVCVRDLLRRSEVVRRLAERWAPRRGMIPVRGILFDKTPEENWPVPWHQDLSIAVEERVEIDGYVAWTKKDGVSHVQAPVELLEEMLTLRVHLDDTPEANGALRVAVGSHLEGRMGAGEIAERVAGGGSVCEAEAGDALWMKPLVLHASARSSSAAAHRRVVHIEYAPADGLALGLEWHE